MPDQDTCVRLLKVLNGIERLADSDMASCCGCSFYWEDPIEPREWGWCRRWPPEPRSEGSPMCEGHTTVDAAWFCGEFTRGIHPKTRAIRARWRHELTNALDKA